MVVHCDTFICFVEPADTSDENVKFPGLTVTEISIVSTGGTLLLFVFVVLVIMLCRNYRQRKPNVSDEEEITPYATVHISGVLASKSEPKRHSLPGMYVNPLKGLPFQERSPSRERPERQLQNYQSSLYENIDQLAKPSASPLQSLLTQPRCENEDDGELCDVLIIKPGYEKPTPGTRRKRRESCAPFWRSPRGGVVKTGMSVYDSIIMEKEMRCRKWLVDSPYSDSNDTRDIHTISEVPSCDERSTIDRINQETFGERASGVEESDDGISLEDIDLGSIVAGWQTSKIQPQLLTSLKSGGRMLHGSHSQTSLHMENQTGLFGFYNNDITQDAEA